MPAIKVRCAPGRMGEYRGRLYTDKSAPFYLVDRKDELGQIRLDDKGRPITAEQALSDISVNRRWGWMVRMEATAKELADAQRLADFEDQPNMFSKFGAHNSGEAAGAVDIGGIGTAGPILASREPGIVPDRNAEQFSVPGGGPESGSKNLEVI